jgi:hypothetical protein
LLSSDEAGATSSLEAVCERVCGSERARERVPRVTRVTGTLLNRAGGGGDVFAGGAEALYKGCGRRAENLPRTCAAGVGRDSILP